MVVMVVMMYVEGRRLGSQVGFSYYYLVVESFLAGNNLLHPSSDAVGFPSSSVLHSP